MDKVYLGGKAQYASSVPPITLDFMVDASAATATTFTLVTLPKGAVVYGFRAVVTEAVVGTTSTVQLGFTGKTMLSAATAEATLVEGYVLGPDESADAAVYTLAASDTFDCIVGTNTLTAGKFDVTIFYHPPRGEAFKNTEYKEFTTA